MAEGKTKTSIGSALLTMAIVIVVGLATLFAVLWVMRSFNNLATSVVVYDVEDRRCAVAVTADGVAMDCWRDDGGGPDVSER